MGTDLSTYKPSELSICPLKPAKITSQESKIPYFCTILKHFERASDLEKHLIMSEVVPLILSVYPSGDELNDLIQKYFYNPDSIQTNIMIIREKATSEMACFSVSYFFKHNYLKNDESKENNYIMTTIFGCIRDKYRRSGIRKEYFKIKGISDLIDYPDCNLLHFEVGINLIGYYGVCEVSNCVFPRHSSQVPDQVQEFITGLIEKLDFPKYEKDPFLVKDSYQDCNYNRDYWRKNYQNLPNDVKFYIDKTDLEKNVGLAFLSVCRLIENNTLNLPPGVKLIEEKPRIPVYFHTFSSPKL